MLAGAALHFNDVLHAVNLSAPVEAHPVPHPMHLRENPMLDQPRLKVAIVAKVDPAIKERPHFIRNLEQVKILALVVEFRDFMNQSSELAFPLKNRRTDPRKGNQPLSFNHLTYGRTHDAVNVRISMSGLGKVELDGGCHF